jgi:putative transposon-encoded protein
MRVVRRKVHSAGIIPQKERLQTVRSKAKFEVYGEEMIEKEVKQSGNSGRVYLPPEWVGKHVKIIRIE